MMRKIGHNNAIILTLWIKALDYWIQETNDSKDRHHLLVLYLFLDAQSLLNAC